MVAAPKLCRAFACAPFAHTSPWQRGQAKRDEQECPKRERCNPHPLGYINWTLDSLSTLRPILLVMARTKQTAHRSTGGKTVRFALVDKAVRKTPSYQAISDLADWQVRGHQKAPSLSSRHGRAPRNSSLSKNDGAFNSQGALSTSGTGDRPRHQDRYTFSIISYCSPSGSR